MIDAFIQKEQQRLEINLNYEITSATQDGFSYHANDQTLFVKAHNKRSVLYALYEYYREPKKQSEMKIARFQRRGNVYEVINDIDYLKKQIQWGTEYYHNEIFFTFFLWDEVKEDLKEELQKRDYEITLGGHSLKYLLANQIDIQAMTNQNISIFKDQKLQNIIISKVIETCQDCNQITRISLWPEDLSINQGDGDQFMYHYLQFLETLQKALDKEKLNVEVEHIVYNAGLSWEMLEKPKGLKSNHHLNTLYAYWGRNYSQSIQTKTNPNQERANKALDDWVHLSKSVTVLEYYSDVFMQSELYPHMPQRIESDLKEYELKKVSGILNLHVPYFTGKHFELFKDKFSYQAIHHINNLVYSQLAFNKTYSLPYDKEDCETLEIYGQTLSYLSRYNQFLFPFRLTDVQKPQSNEVKEELTENLMICKKRLESLSFNDPILQKDLELSIHIIAVYLKSWQTI